MAVLVLDASAVIALLDARDAHHAGATAELAAIESDELVLPASAYSEALVAAYREGARAVAVVDGLLVQRGIRVHPVDGAIGRRAAELRARHAGLRLPDALVLATGDVLGADAVLTADRAWLRVSKRARAISRASLT